MPCRRDRFSPERIRRRIRILLPLAMVAALAAIGIVVADALGYL